MGHARQTERYHTSQSFSYINKRFGVCSTRSGRGNGSLIQVALKTFGRRQYAQQQHGCFVQHNPSTSKSILIIQFDCDSAKLIMATALNK